MVNKLFLQYAVHAIFPLDNYPFLLRDILSMMKKKPVILLIRYSFATERPTESETKTMNAPHELPVNSQKESLVYSTFDAASFTDDSVIISHFFKTFFQTTSYFCYTLLF